MKLVYNPTKAKIYNPITDGKSQRFERVEEAFDQGIISEQEFIRVVCDMFPCPREDVEEYLRYKKKK